MPDLAVFVYDNHGGTPKEFDVGADETLFIPNLGEYSFPDGPTLNNSISSLQVGDDVFVRLYVDRGYQGRYESYLPGDGPNHVFYGNGLSSLRMWKLSLDGDDPRASLERARRILDGLSGR